jgi:hypothetical protein
MNLLYFDGLSGGTLLITLPFLQKEKELGTLRY